MGEGVESLLEYDIMPSTSEAGMPASSIAFFTAQVPSARVVRLEPRV